MNTYQVTFESWDKVAALYQDKFMDLDLYNDTYDLFCNSIEKQHAKVLEIGCGPGNMTRYILNKRPDILLEAIDIAPSMIELARKNNPAAHFQVMDCRDIDTLPSKYNAILCGFCLPYLEKNDVIKFVKDCAELLTAGGIFYLSVIEGAYENSGYEVGSSGDAMYVYYYDADFIKKILQDNHFELVALHSKHYTKSDGSSSTHLILMAKIK